MSLDLSSHVLTFLTFWPLLGALVILLIPGGFDREIKMTSAIFNGISLLVSIWLYSAFNSQVAAPQFVERTSWIPYFNIEYFMAVDGVSITLVLLTTLVTFLATFASFGIDKQVKGYFILYQILHTGMMGVFCAFDFFLFFVFWEVMLLPMYFLIGIWGGPNREYAAIKFFLFTMAGSVLMLLGMIALYFASAENAVDRTWAFDKLSQLHVFKDVAGSHYWTYVWWGIFAAFIVKVPSFPVHTWLPDAHVEAPTPISVILAGVLLKMGGYGILRVNVSIFPEVSREMAWAMALLGVISIVYGAFCAMAQQDFKRLVAYASVSSMGFVTLGIAVSVATGNPAGANGAIFQMVAHGFYSSALFLLVGVVYDRAHHRDLEGFGGLAQKMPMYAGISGIAFMCALGLPGLMVFISEAMVLIGTFDAWPWLAVLAVTSVIITAAYMLWTVQRVFLGKLNERYHDIDDLTAREKLTLIPLAIGIVVFGFYPMPILRLMEKSVEALFNSVGTGLG